MTVPEGFKQTEVGVIPQDWEVETISEIASVKTGPFGSLLHEKDYVSSGTPIITVEHLGEHGITSENTPNVSDSDKSRLKEYILRKHDIVFSRVGSIDRSALVGDYETGWLFSGRLLRVRAITRRAKPTYLNYHFKSESFRKKIYSVAVGQTMASLNTEILKRVKVPLPTPAEQTAIATALNDMDTLIEGVEKLLEKKRRIKQGAMQELLRPKDGWNEKELGECADIIGGGTPSSFNNLFWNGNINWFTPTEVGFSKYLYGSKRKITEAGYMNSSAKMLPAGAILLTSRAGIGDLGILMQTGCTNQGFQSLVAKETIDNEFLYYLMGTIKGELLQNASGSTFLEITPRRLGKIKISIPNKSEQKEIAAILSDMDTEIQQLETQLTKYRQLKTGMMQELLTGKKRLI